MRTLIPKTQVMNIHILGSGGKKSSLIGCMQMSLYWGSGTPVGKKNRGPAVRPPDRDAAGAGGRQ